jgi:antitoxin HicB
MKNKSLEYYLSLPYTISLKRYDDQGGYWVARILELPYCITHGATKEEALIDIEDTKKDWLESNIEDGFFIPEPAKYTGQYHLRMPPTLHEALAMKAEAEEVSLNQFMVMALARAVGYPEAEKKSVEKEPKQELLTVKETKRKYSKK